MSPLSLNSLLSPMLGSSVTDYFFQSNLAGQGIVLILLGFSLLAWGAMFCKKADLAEMKRQNNSAARIFSHSRSVFEAAATRGLNGPFASVLKDAVAAFQKSGLGESADAESQLLAKTFVENAIERSLTVQQLKYESQMILLGTVISGAPFLGLLGTAWGVMDCFGALSNQASVTLQQLAPGVAGSLLTTVAGLLVAIPAVFGYNYLTSKSRELMTETESFASLVSDTMEMQIRDTVKYAAQRAQTPQPVAQYAPATPAYTQQPAQPQYPQYSAPAPTQQPVAPAPQYVPQPQYVAAPTPPPQPAPIPQPQPTTPPPAPEKKAPTAKPEPDASIIDFSLDDDNDDAPIPPRDFDD